LGIVIVRWATMIGKARQNDQEEAGIDDGVASACRHRTCLFFRLLFWQWCNITISYSWAIRSDAHVRHSGFWISGIGESGFRENGYEPNRAYQIQSGLANAATAITALLVYLLDWGRYADATIVTAMLMFFTFSAANHVATAIMERNMKPVNLLRPAMALLLIGFLLPPMIKALSQ